MRSINLGLKFLLELAAIAGFAVWGWQVGNAVTGVVMAVLTPAAAIVVWGRFAAPRAATRLPTRWRVPLELSVFLLAAVALAASRHPVLALVFVIAVVVNALGLSVFRQWES